MNKHGKSLWKREEGGEKTDLNLTFIIERAYDNNNSRTETNGSQ